ncbi:DHH family phosphoesterase [Helicobacter labacensis]|uniref:DHH family phosphoesterase n=1 Tax=Helicobacter labacensis TaxID=2316079 RepID=UPI001968CA94|nr:DHH family phosphoesterase [Helicobacter labacensis]
MLEAFATYIENIAKDDGKHKFSLDSVLEMGAVCQALSLLHEAIKAQRPIIIGGDYDCDGMSGTALACFFLKEVLAYPFVNYIIPRRNTDSYGMSVELLQAYATKERLVQETYTPQGIIHAKPLDLHNALFLTIDNGATIPDEVYAFLRACNTPLILSDHHEFLEGRIPACDAFVHPLLSDNHPFKGISGACVGYLLMLAYAKHYHIKMRPQDWTYMQVLAGLSTIGDMMDLSQPYNRHLVKRMDQTLQTSMPANLAQIYQLKNRLYPQTYKLGMLSWDIIAPINAVGRMDGIEGCVHCSVVVDLLSKPTANPYYAHLLLQAHQQRKNLIAQAKENLEVVVCGVVVHAGGAIARGLMGLIANQLLEQHASSLSLCWRYQQESIEASLRSKEIDLIALLGHLQNNGIGVVGGGHKRACGMVFESQQDFQNALLYLERHHAF